MELTWIEGSGPGTTEELANLVESEGSLIRHLYVSRKGLRCLWGVIEDWGFQGEYPTRRRRLSPACLDILLHSQLTTDENDRFLGTPEELCVEMAQRIRVA